MERPVNMQKFMDDVIDNFYAGYAHLLACQIKDEGFTALEYNVSHRRSTCWKFVA